MDRIIVNVTTYCILEYRVFRIYVFCTKINAVSNKMFCKVIIRYTVVNMKFFAFR